MGPFPKAQRQTDFPRGRVALVATYGRVVAPRPPPLWPWEALDGSLRTFIGKTRKEDTALVQFTSFGASFRALSGASSDVSEEVSVFRLRRCLGRSVSSQERERNNDE